MLQRLKMLVFSPPQFTSITTTTTFITFTTNTTNMKIAMLGSGFIARFYADSLAAQRRKDTLVSVYSRSAERAAKFANDYGLPHSSDNMDEVVGNPDVDVVVIRL